MEWSRCSGGRNRVDALSLLHSTDESSEGYAEECIRMRVAEVFPRDKKSVGKATAVGLLETFRCGRRLARRPGELALVSCEVPQGVQRRFKAAEALGDAANRNLSGQG